MELFIPEGGPPVTKTAARPSLKLELVNKIELTLIFYYKNSYI